MARARKVDVAQEDEPIKVADKQPVKRYYAKYLSYTFDYPVVDENGTPLYRTNAITGMPILDDIGNKTPIHRSEKFLVLNQVWSKGYLSYADDDLNDQSAQARARGKALEQLAKDRGVNVQTEDDYDKTTNPAKYAEKIKNRELQEMLAAKDAEIADLRKKVTLPQLEDRLAEIEKQ